MTLSVVALDAPLGAVVQGVDLSAPMMPSLAAALRDAMAKHLVLVFPDQHLSALGYADAIRSAFGALVPHILDQYHHADTHDVSVISNVVESGKGRTTKAPAGAYWHSDLSYMAGPADATFLYALEVPSDGGDTVFADMGRAYETLPEALKRAVAGRSAIHHMFGGKRGYEAKVTLTAEQAARIPEVVHPIVRVHPVSGRRALFVNPGFTRCVVGMEPVESDALLTALYAHATRPEFQYRHKWRVGDVVGGDNRATVHTATGGYTEPRTLYRTIVGCGAPVAGAMAA
jgi:taurine dioxygenase